MFFRRFETAGEFSSAIEQPFLEEEAKHGLLLGLAERLRDPKECSIYPRPPYFATMEGAAGRIAILRTPPYKFILATSGTVSIDEMNAFARSVAIDQLDAPGVVGESLAAHQFGDAWSQITGMSAVPRMAQRVYCLNTVVRPTHAAGNFRMATTGDLSLLIEHTDAFYLEAMGRIEHGARELTSRRVDQGHVGVWEHGTIVSSAHVARRTRSGASISLVYTTPDLRGRGYASNCVAALSQRLLEEGFHFCTLNTDRSNPTSNKIYEAIGYEFVCDAAELAFVAP